MLYLLLIVAALITQDIRWIIAAIVCFLIHLAIDA